jgi:hypothetical protein
MGIVEIKQRGFVLCDVKKLIIYFATVRDIARDQVYATRYGASAAEIEKLMPSDAVFTAFSAFRLTFKEAPSDYSEVYVYANAEALGEIRKRFPQKNGPPNVVVFEADGFISKGKVSIAQIFADLWNLKSWYAKEYLDALERRLFG